MFLCSNDNYKTYYNTLTSLPGTSKKSFDENRFKMRININKIWKVIDSLINYDKSPNRNIQLKKGSNYIKEKILLLTLVIIS